MGTGNEEQRQALAWPHGIVSVESLGGMVGPTVFVLPDGRQIAPFQIAPWAEEAGTEGIPPILRRLRGEWPCVPFGSDGDRAAANGWPGSTATPTIDTNAHGFSSNNYWSLHAGEGSALGLSIAYPETHPIASLHRRIVPDPNASALDFELEVKVRRDCDLPIGLHPVFRLPVIAGSVRLEIDGHVGAMTFPGNPDASSIFSPNTYVDDWHQIPLRDGSTLDPSRVPLTQHTEEVLQLLKAQGKVSLWNTVEGYRATLTWNKEHFPSLMFWFSNYGRKAAPWSGRHLALGVEPICGALDLGPQISAQPNPVSAHGVATTRHFSAGERFVTRYRIEVEAAPIV
jgi:hypothetical protein